MTRRGLPTDDDLKNLLDAIRGGLDDLEAGVIYVARRQQQKRFTLYDLRDRCKGDVRGYPTRSISGGSGSGVVDDENKPIPYATSGDRVGELAVFGELGGPKETLEALLTLLEGARSRVDQALGELKESVPPPPPPDPDGCKSCARIPGNFSPLWEKHEATERCHFCADWRPEKVEVEVAGQKIVVKAAGEDLPIEAIAFHQMRRNLTTKFWRELAAKQLFDSKPKKAKAFAG